VGFCNTVEGIRAALRSTVSMKDYVIDNVRFRVEESDNLKRHPLRSQVSGTTDLVRLIGGEDIHDVYACLEGFQATMGSTRWTL